MPATGKNWDRWVEGFRLRLRQKMEQDCIDQQDVANQINVPHSTFSAQMNRSLKPWFVDRIAAVWPDEFGDDPIACRQEMLGITVSGESGLTHLRSLLLYFHEIKRQSEEGIETITVLLKKVKRAPPLWGNPPGRLERRGAGERSRTADLRFTRALLYQLSYTGPEK